MLRWHIQIQMEYFLRHLLSLSPIRLYNYQLENLVDLVIQDTAPVGYCKDYLDLLVREILETLVQLLVEKIESI